MGLMLDAIVLNGLFILNWWWLWPISKIGFSVVTIVLLITLFKRIHLAQKKQSILTDTLERGLRSLHDGDYSISLADKGTKNSSQVISLFNQVTDKLRLEKQSLYQRELLLDKVVNATDVITVLVNHRGFIIFANLAAREFFRTKEIIGQQWTSLVTQQAQQLTPQLQTPQAIIQLTDGNDNQLSRWHWSQHSLRLHGAEHKLIMLKSMTKELNQQELKTWKKVIRVVNHELNNSIAPISSMCHSGKILAEKSNQPQLDMVFNTIGNRIQKLSEFVTNYSQLARLSTPNKQSFDLVTTMNRLKPLYQFTLRANSQQFLYADESQIEQLLINLLKNANEVCPDEPCLVDISPHSQYISLTVKDNGPGMSSDVLQQAFLPYFSTKSNGSGVGLSICKEVVEAHDGSIQLTNHAQGGLQITVTLPIDEAN